MKKLYHIILIIVLLFPLGCSTDFLNEVNPVQKTGETFFSGDSDAQAAALSLYGYTGTLYLGNGFISFLTVFDEMRGDDFTLPKNFYNNAIVPWLSLNYNAETSQVSLAWSNSYAYIYRANWIIDNITDNVNVSDAVKKKALAEAYFFRGFCYFNLTRLFGEVPLMISKTTEANFYPAKATNEACWNQVFSDYQKALDIGGLVAPTANFVDGRINTAVVNAMMARAYLYRTLPGSTKYWDKVKQYTTTVEGLNTYALEPMVDFSSNFVYTKGDKWVKNKEMIWVHGFSYGPTYGGNPFLYTNTARVAYQCMPVGYNTTLLKNDAGISFLAGNGNTGNAYIALSTGLSDIMINYYSKGDKRTKEYLYYPSFNSYGLNGTAVYLKKTVNSDSLYQKVVATNGTNGEFIHIKKYEIREFVGSNIWDGGWNHSLVYPIVRYADILLMRAEAEFNLGNESVARSYLKKITDRAGFAADYLNQFSGQSLLDEILRQRRVELMFESLRVPDLIRLDKFKYPYVGTYPGSVTWNEKLKVLPIPRSEIDVNPNLVQQDLWR